jgi:hypothetical protein
VLAAPSYRLLNPACGIYRCDEFAAKRECEDELSIAKADPVLQPAEVQSFLCYNGHGRRSFNIVHPGTYHDANLNDYQNAFGYGTTFRSNLGEVCCAVGDPVNPGTGQVLHYIEPDALGTPRVVVDRTRGANGTAIWNWTLEAKPSGIRRRIRTRTGMRRTSCSICGFRDNATIKPVA